MGVSALDGSGSVQASLAGDSTAFTYDDLGRTQTVTDSTGVTTDTYDADGNLIQQEKPQGTINYVYSAATGRLTETWTGADRAHEGTDTSYAYDAQGRLHTTTATVLNSVTLTTPQVTTDTYDADGNKKTETLPNGELTTDIYNGRNQLTDDIVTRNGVNVFAQHYTLANNGRRDAVSETQYSGNGTVFSTASTGWGYDNLDRLTGETYTSSAGGNYTDTFSYDLVGNRLNKTHATGTDSGSIAYGYNNDDQIQTETATLNGSAEYSTAYGYDLNGSLTSKARTGTNAETDSYTYDLQNRLATSTVNGTTTSYSTDAAGDRVSETTAGNTTTSLVDDNNLTGYSQVLEQKTSGGTITVSYIIGDRVLGQGTSGVPAYLVVDGQGSTRLVTDPSGSVTARYAYDAFGNALGFNAAGAVSSILYTGQQFDAGLSEYHLRARDYDPTIGRFSSFDSANNGNDDPRALHKYLYANADPLNDVDPTGHDSLSAAALGRAVHKALGQDFTDKLDPFGVSGPSIVNILKALGPVTSFIGPITSRFPDLVDIDPKDKEVFEIKPANLKAYATGLAQLIGYIYLLNKLDPTGGWHEGTVATYLPPPILTIVDPEDVEDPVDVVAVFPPIAGVITYSSVEDVVKQRVKNVAEADDAELDDEIGIDTLNAEIGGF